MDVPQFSLVTPQFDLDTAQIGFAAPQFGLDGFAALPIALPHGDISLDLAPNIGTIMFSDSINSG
jgi:hypothetical protein